MWPPNDAPVFSQLISWIDVCNGFYIDLRCNNPLCQVLRNKSFKISQVVPACAEAAKSQKGRIGKNADAIVILATVDPTLSGDLGSQVRCLPSRAAAIHFISSKLAIFTGYSDT